MRRTALFFAAYLALTAPASAQQDPLGRIEQLESNQRKLQTQIEQIKRELQQARIERKVQAEQSKRLTLDLKFRSGFHLRSPDNQFHFQVGGHLQTGGLFSLDDDDPLTDTFRVRRAFIRTNGHMFRYYHWMVLVDFSRGKATLEDAWIDVRFWDQAKLMFGQFYRPFSQEVLTDNKYIKLVERSMVSNFIPLLYDVGAMLYGRLFDRRLRYYLAIQNGAGGNRLDENDGKDVISRLVLVPWANTRNFWLRGLRLGAAVSYGDQGPVRAGGLAAGPRTAVGTRIYTYRPDTIRQGERVRWNIQGAWNVGPFGLRGELMQLKEDVRRAGLRENVTHTGWYVTGAYFLTGERMGFGRVRPKHAFDPHDGKDGLGAWELVARVGQIQTEAGSRRFVTGSLGATQLMAGLNWYPNSMVRLSLNYQHAIFRSPVDGTGSEDSLMLRLQIEY